jgi:undecaprenyl-diphosphatase
MIKDKPAKDEITWAIAAAVGAAQLVAAVFPGTSRSGATILVMLVLGLSRVAATEFTFLVGIPTILAGGGLKIFKALHHPAADAPAEDWAMVALGFVVAAVVSFVVVRFFLKYVQSHTFNAFGLYRIAAAGVIFGLLATQ